jgi:glycine C-acetyltransferase
MDPIEIGLRGSIQSYLKQVREEAPDWLSGTLLQRFAPLPMGWQCLRELGVDTFSKQMDGVAGPTVTAVNMDGRPLGSGINFGSQDCLGLARHPAVLEAVRQSIEYDGLHSGASAALFGNSRPTRQLELALADYLGRAQVEIFQGGWAACYGAVRSLVTEGDHVILDTRSHTSLVEGARASGATVHFFRHLDDRELEQILIRLRETAPHAGVLVVTESVFSMDGDVPDLQRHVGLCRAHHATLLVDASHDMGSFGPRGLGMLTSQGVLDQVDVIVASFSKAFGSNGGFVASHEPGFGLALRFAGTSSTFASQLSPTQSATILKALEIIRSDEGQERRDRLLANCEHARQALRDAGWKVLGWAGPLVPVEVGGIGRTRLIQRELLKRGVITNLVEYPAVPKNGSRLRLQIMVDHTREQFDHMIEAFRQAANAADAALAEINMARPADQQIS